MALSLNYEFDCRPLSEIEVEPCYHRFLGRWGSCQRTGMIILMGGDSGPQPICWLSHTIGLDRFQSCLDN